MVLLESLNLPMGTTAPDFNLKGVDDKNHSLAEYQDKKALVIIFTCNHCPYVKAVIDRLIKLQKDYKDKGVQLIGINSNDPTHYPDDDFAHMQKIAEELSFNFPYLVDETQGVAKEYKAQCTPDIYVFDEDRKLFYHGRLDDNWQEEKAVTKHELRDALNLLLAGKDSPETQTPSMGCSIKWRE